MPPPPSAPGEAAAAPPRAGGRTGDGAGCRVSPRGAYDGPCEVEEGDGSLRVTAGLRDFVIRERKSEGDWGLVTINGIEAMRHGIDVAHLSFATTDLNEFLGVAR